jgi:hypothetical protein
LMDFINSKAPWEKLSPSHKKIIFFIKIFVSGE